MSGSRLVKTVKKSPMSAGSKIRSKTLGKPMTSFKKDKTQAVKILKSKAAMS
jgi:hypothetical protein